MKNYHSWDDKYLYIFVASAADPISSLFNNNNLMGYAAAARKYSDYAVSGIGAAAAHHAHYAAAAHHANPYAQSHHYDPLTAATNFGSASVSSASSSAPNVNSSGGSGMMSHVNSSGMFSCKIQLHLIILKFRYKINIIVWNSLYLYLIFSYK